MFDSRTPRILFKITELIALVTICLGLFFAVYGVIAGYRIGAIYSLMVAGSGMSLMMLTYIGSAAIHIADTNSAILSKLSEK
jgi:hypothetical protein